MWPKEERAALLKSKEYFDLERRGVIDKVLEAQKCLIAYLAYGQRKYIFSADTAIRSAIYAIEELEKNENAKVQ